MNSIPVFYTPKQVANAYSYSPSASKPGHVILSWEALSIPINILEPTPLTVEEICLAHHKPYVEGVLACRKDNGFKNRLPDVAASLPYTNGAFVCAAREALLNQQVAVAPVSGFHHANYYQGSGFCTFNGLVIAAQLLKREGRVKCVGILDFDQHYGDGTVAIIRELQLGAWLSQYSAGADYQYIHQDSKHDR